jgi:hypothetical protein
MKALSVFLFSLSIAFAASGAEVAGVNVADKASLANADLTLNGAGLRKLIFFNVYAMGLYLPKKTTNAAEAVAMEGPKRVSLHMLRDVGHERFTKALVEGITENHSEAEIKALQPRIDALNATMAQIGEAKKGSTITLDWNGTATLIGIDGKPTGQAIAGADFYRALLRIWLGDKPVQEDLKKALLGGN